MVSPTASATQRRQVAQLNTLWRLVLEIMQEEIAQKILWLIVAKGLGQCQGSNGPRVMERGRELEQ